MTIHDDLEYLFEFNGARRLTVGLDREAIEVHARSDRRLQLAVSEALKIHRELQKTHLSLLRLDEKKQIEFLQEGFINFYGPDAVNPYVPLAAAGPWIISTCGAVIFDAGGYGMLGQGHNPKDVLDALTQPQVMANIMTASFQHREFIDALRAEIGHTRGGIGPSMQEPFKAFLCLNSGSEAVTLCMRIADTNAYNLLAAGGRHAGKKSRFVAFKGGFHGRTDRPAQVSDSCLATYKRTLASFSQLDNLITIVPNDSAALEEVFERAEKEGFFIEALLFEPVMGEGNPGLALEPAYYKRARELSIAHGSMLIIDAIQAGIRTYGVLSIVDYPGFQELEPPDMETYSKALNAGQFPMSVVAFGPRAKDLYVRGTYGNTMTANPRALAVACTVLRSLNADLRQNIVQRGHEILQKLGRLAAEFPDVIEKVQGTGLLFSVAINPKVFKVVGHGGLEEFLRMKGLGVIHGAANSLRYTPPFDLTSLQVDLIESSLRHAILFAPRNGADHSGGAHSGNTPSGRDSGRGKAPSSFSAADATCDDEVACR